MDWTPKPPEVAEIEKAQRDHQFMCEMLAKGAVSRDEVADAMMDIYAIAKEHGYFVGVCESAFWRWQPWMEEPGYRRKES